MSQQTPCGPKHHIERQKCSFWSIISIFGHFLSTGGSETENFNFFLQNMKSSGDFVSENMSQSNFLGESFFPIWVYFEEDHLDYGNLFSWVTLRVDRRRTIEFVCE